MSGGTITGNSSDQGAVSVGSKDARMNFSGNAYVLSNFSKTDGFKCNVYLDQDTNEIINTTGLSKSAGIGVYVEDSFYTDHGDNLDDFGSYPVDVTGETDVNALYLQNFSNDRNGLTGAARTTDQKIVWLKVVPLEVTKILDAANITVEQTFKVDVTFKGREEGYQYQLPMGDEILSLKEGEDGTQEVEFKMSENGRISQTGIYIPTGTNINLEEVFDPVALADEYKTQITVKADSNPPKEEQNNGRSVEFTVDNSAISASAIVYNYSVKVAPTGLHIPTSPFRILLYMGLLLTGLWALIRRRKVTKVGEDDSEEGRDRGR